jgi:hypothetical protein
MTIPVSQWSKVTLHICQFCGKQFGKRAKPSVTPKYCSHSCSSKSQPKKIILKPKTPYDAYAEMKEIMLCPR